MNCVSDFLQKFLNLEKDNNTKLLLILESVKRFTNMDLKKENLEIVGDNLKLNISPVQRSEIFMHKQQIQDSLIEQKIFLRII